MQTMTEQKQNVNNFRTELVDSAKKSLIERLKNPKTKQDVKDFMKLMARFHRYSFGNQMLIAMQYPNASDVAGFGTWKQFGRSINSGSKAIRILAPCPYKVLDEDDNEIDKIGFRVINVFDVSQTNGKPLPEIDDIKGSDKSDLYARAKEYTASRNIKLQYTTKGRAAGYLNLDGITIKTSKAKNKECATLLHELAHFELGHLGDKDKTRELQELEAECTAFIVGQAFGLETKSEKYLAGWSKFDDEKILAAFDNVHKAAQKIIKGLTRNESGSAA